LKISHLSSTYNSVALVNKDIKQADGTPFHITIAYNKSMGPVQAGIDAKNLMNMGQLTKLSNPLKLEVKYQEI